MSESNLRAVLETLDPKARDDLRRVLFHDRQTVTRSPLACSATATNEATIGPTASTF
jgi:hypothetical protein